jgi:Carboxypeptidase regulatory-like domain
MKNALGKTPGRAAFASILFTFLPAFAQTFNISGIVVADQTGSPIARTRMTLSGGRNREWSMVTGGDGKFSFDVPQGKYSLIAERRGWLQGFGAVDPSSPFSSAVVNGPDQDTSHVVFRWFATCAVFGKVVDDRGEPVENATVQLIRESIVAGRKLIRPFLTQKTDDLGNYRFAPLAGGTYYLAVTGEPWYAKQLAMFHTIHPDEPSPPPVTFSPSYYPSSADPRGAAPILLKPGAEMKADFALGTVRAVTVRGSCPNSERCAGTLSLYLQGVGGVETLQTTTYLLQPQSGDGVPPGRYSARFTGGGGAMHKTIDIGSSDVTLEVIPKPAPSVSGKVTFADPGTKPRSTMYLRLVNEATGNAIARAINAEGSFLWQNVGVGRYRPQLSGTDGFFLSEISVEGVTFKDGVLDLVDGASVHLSIVASDDIGRLRGFVKNGDQPVPAALVVLAPRVPSSDPYAYRGFQTESDGSFDFTQVRAGDYLLVAVDRIDLDYANPEALRPYLAAATPFRVEHHRVHAVTIPPFSPTLRNK